MSVISIIHHLRKAAAARVSAEPLQSLEWGLGMPQGHLRPFLDEAKCSPEARSRRRQRDACPPRGRRRETAADAGAKKP